MNGSSDGRRAPSRSSGDAPDSQVRVTSAGDDESNGSAQRVRSDIPWVRSDIQAAIDVPQAIADLEPITIFVTQNLVVLHLGIGEGLTHQGICVFVDGPQERMDEVVSMYEMNAVDSNARVYEYTAMQSETIPIYWFYGEQRPLRPD